MQRLSAAVLAAGVLALVVSGCGSDESTDANGLRKGSTGAAAGTTTAGAPSSAAPSSATAAPGEAPSTTPAAAPSGSGADITCAEFRKLDTEQEKAVIELILAANPDSPFTGSPNVALGTAKLVCLAPSVADEPVATAAGLVAE
ncbi:hypothetical protein [Nocardia asteroides]|uniref:hypothetical protein n=1 Tax=Nocardia asteroides TaxID=1824 RepID=UPI001E375481|nr:hypothetical protein [Nocardia asteroides]UGT64767.1 hypothetical protein LTT61_16430 [Nocardia asteroides]